MERLLLLAHRIPYPPNKGDKIRSFNLLKYLSRRYHIYLGAYVDDPEDWRFAEDVQAYCADSCLVGLNRIRPGARAAAALVTGEAVTPRYFREPRLARWVDRTLEEEGIRRVLAFSSPMAHLVSRKRAKGLRMVTDFVDVDSDKWAQYGDRKGLLRGWIYRREARRLREFEHQVASRSAASVFVSPAEAELFSRMVPEAAPRVTSVENGVDTAYFNPGLRLASPYPEGVTPLVFTGAMDYWANGDAAEWFARYIFPRVHAHRPDARFFVVGARPTEAVRQLQQVNGVTVTGGVRDIRPYLAHARLAVAPMRVARGIQNKVLEAMAMARPVVATGKALEGLELPEASRLQADDEDGQVERILSVLPGDGGMGERNREWVRKRYAWERHMDHIAGLLEGCTDLGGGPVPQSDLKEMLRAVRPA
jgi:sugar transferase (PEP-CTERM/EpsH1 system associated)